MASIDKIEFARKGCGELHFHEYKDAISCNEKLIY